MILNSNYQVKLSKKYRKILYLYAAHDQTFVFLAMISARKDGVVHVNKAGQVLFQHEFGKPMEAMGMLSPKQVVFLETRLNKISVLDLMSHQFRRYPHYFANQESDQANIWTFSETKYLCVEEKGRYNQNQFKLTYYQYLFNQLDEDKPCKTLTVYQSKEGEWTYQYRSFKVNSYSMICWCKTRHDDAFQFKTYEIQNGKGQFRQYKFATPLPSDPLNPKTQAIILNAWQLRPNNLLFVCVTNRSAGKTHGGTVINDNFVIDILKGQIRQANFTFGPYQDFLIDVERIGAYSMFRTYKFQKGKVLKTPTYFVDNFSENIIAEQMWQCSSEYKYQLPGYSSGMLIQGQYAHEDVDKFKVTLKRVMKYKQACLFFLDELGLQLDQDLIADVLQVMGLS